LKALSAWKHAFRLNEGPSYTVHFWILFFVICVTGAKVETEIESAVDADQEYIYSLESATPPSACYAHLFCTNVNDLFILF